MSRDIKFRVRLYSGELLGYEWTDEHGDWWHRYKGERFLGTFTTVGKMLREQYTGLKDKNGEEIYEGDICEFPYQQNDGLSEQEVDKVSFENGEFVLFKWPLKQWASKCIVIGNICDDPELLQ